MSVFRESLIDAYRWFTEPARRCIAHRLSASSSWPAGILFYHRVSDSVPNSWTISNSNFVKHLDLISEIATFQSLDEVVESQRNLTRSRLSVAITFDDGYAENLDQAIPELIRRKIPCTYFVTTDNVERQVPFKHDFDRQMPLCVNTISEVRWLAKNGIQIGGHTASHLDLGKPWGRDRLLAEISDSRKKLQDWTGQEIAYFAFPQGFVQHMSQAAIDMVFESGYRAFTSAYGGWNFPGGDSMHLNRIHGDCGTASLLNWLTLDPRKIHQTRKLQYVAPKQLTEICDLPAIPTDIFSGFASPTALSTSPL